ncbi:hypothetical protein IA54_010415 [Xanthomonas phaseoli pv. syngonii LMG 9055]|uniref:Uncharacterized protein n=1 Tax=Xanthomonas phaseoli pv. syngonii LMG 9055 TaxID=1437878 RepID=A0A1V9GY46_9XANT|nr:hypothetical protein IA54_010415 [Xanthomonas phaseoli pv. syngonii LMG 9055]
MHAPEALDALYRQLEDTLVQLLRPHVCGGSGMSAEDFDQILPLATNRPESVGQQRVGLETAVAGQITMTVATVRIGASETSGKKKSARR